ncbi:LysR substrate-binding domain-containing protein [Microvirga pakistanensis]|uniref:LysR substrate-binding domain-containing protein n=1 Tax=Microvirga pakistanensis TaxID=1682650 RepID=UPI00106BC301|nr:LysR substrate-binding domain-containing protein [Microvirga pakistanensis]
MAGREIPPLNSLYVFAMSARYGSFVKAAAELNVTQSAVSRQIAVLENFLGIRLFHRGPGGSQLTEAGADFAAEIEGSFDSIAAASRRLMERGPDRLLQVRAYATFAAKWLIPHLSNYYRRYPKAAISVSSTVKPVDFTREAVEIAIQFGSGDWPGTHSIRLFDDVIQPVASPELLKRLPVNSPSDLSRHVLLHSRYRRRDWLDWLAASGVELDSDRGTTFESSALTYLAAMEGLGIAMGQIALLSEELTSGKLVALFEGLRRPLGYYVVWPTDRPETTKIRLFRDWLVREAQAAPTALSRAPTAGQDGSGEQSSRRQAEYPFAR